jgi:AcrR family transcriptional regulator
MRAAVETFTERGYDGATIREIASRAGVTEMTLLRHFGTKDALLREALHDRAPVPPAQAAELPTELDQAVKALSQRLWEGMMGPRRNLMRVIIGESVRRPEFGEPLSHVPQEFAHRFGAYLRAQQEAGRVRRGDPKLQAMALLGMFFAIAVGGDYVDVGEHTPEQIQAAFADIFLRGVKND